MLDAYTGEQVERKLEESMMMKELIWPWGLTLSKIAIS
jgi:hypothetical protein